MVKLYLYGYTIFLILLVALGGVVLHASLGAMLSFLWGVCAIIIIVNIGKVVQISEIIVEKFGIRLFSRSNSTRHRRDRSRIGSAFNRRSPASTNSEENEVNELILQVLAQIEREEAASRPSRRRNIAARPNSTRAASPISFEYLQWEQIDTASSNSNSPSSNQTDNAIALARSQSIAVHDFLSDNSRHVDIGELLRELIGHPDRVTRDIFIPGEKVYLCLRCQSGYHKESWEYLGCICERCKTAARVREYTLPG